MRPLPYKHKFRVENGKYIWEDPAMFAVKRSMLEGKQGYAIIEEEVEEGSPNQLAYYFGGIIRQECMNSDCFLGMTEREIHEALLLEVAGTVRHISKNGRDILVNLPGDFEIIRRNKSNFSEYIEKVIAVLNTDYGIFPKPASHYKYNKFKIEVKHY